MRQTVVKIENGQDLDERFEQLVNIYRAAYRPRYDGVLPTGVDLLVIADFEETAWDCTELAECLVKGIKMLSTQGHMFGTHIAFTNVPEPYLDQLFTAAELFGTPLIFLEGRTLEVLWPQNVDQRLKEAYEIIEEKKAASCYDIVHGSGKSRRVADVLLKRLRGYGLLYTTCEERHPVGPGRPYRLYSVIDGAAV